MEGYEQNDGMDTNDRDEIYSNAVKAGKRTYFFDVKATRNNDYYLTITESKKKFDNNGNPSYEKHKVFLYKEDFDKFVEGYWRGKSCNQWRTSGKKYGPVNDTVIKY